jgi:hypothetical protein
LVLYPLEAAAMEDETAAALEATAVEDVWRTRQQQRLRQQQ